MNSSLQLIQPGSIFFCSLLLLSISACDNTLDINAPFVERPVIWGILNQFDSVHKIRVERTFSANEENAFDVAKQADSIYFDASYRVEITSPSNGQTVELERVSLPESRASGDFAEQPNVVYQVSREVLDLTTNQMVQISVIDPSGVPLATATTTIVGPLDKPVNSPPTELVDFSPDRSTRLVFRPAENASVFDVRWRIRVAETIGGQTTIRELVWVVAENLVNSDQATLVDFEVDGKSFFTFLGNSLEANPGIRRQIIDMDYEVFAGGAELLELFRLTQANLGITSSQEIPSFTNVSGGLGIFSSGSELVLPGIGLTAATLNLLRTNEITEGLNFQ